jgi:CheY-specific phosphatase CheX
MNNQAPSKVLFQQFQTVSEKRMASHSGCETIKSIEAPIFLKDRHVYANWMAVILVSGKGFRASFKVHFDLLVIKEFMATNFHKDVKTIQKHQCMDFVKEFCNLMAGGIQQTLDKIDIKVGISLPIVTKGFDELFEVKSDAEDLIDFWQLDLGIGKILCHLHTQILDPEVLQKIDSYNDLPEEEEEDDGEIDFL